MPVRRRLRSTEPSKAFLRLKLTTSRFIDWRLLRQKPGALFGLRWLGLPWAGGGGPLAV